MYQQKKLYRIEMTNSFIETFKINVNVVDEVELFKCVYEMSLNHLKDGIRKIEIMEVE